MVYMNTITPVFHWGTPLCSRKTYFTSSTHINLFLHAHLFFAIVTCNVLKDILNLIEKDIIHVSISMRSINFYPQSTNIYPFWLVNDTSLTSLSRHNVTDQPFIGLKSQNVVKLSLCLIIYSSGAILSLLPASASVVCRFATQ